MSRQPRRLSIQSLETRKLMAGDMHPGGGLLNDGGTLQATDNAMIGAVTNETQITIRPIDDGPTLSVEATDTVMTSWRQRR